MPKIKEIRKIENPIKEIKKEKVESLDDEFDEDIENEDFVNGFNGVRRFNKTSTLDASETPQDSAPRERRISKEDEQELHFRPSYSGGGQENKISYTPVGSSESGAVVQTRVLGEDRPLERRNDLQQQNQNINDNQRSGEMGGGRAYIEDNDKKRDKRRDM
ncbi:MAG: hypothetical protein AABX96_02020 [Nanoarchaeota archaeon]